MFTLSSIAREALVIVVALIQTGVKKIASVWGHSGWFVELVRRSFHNLARIAADLVQSLA